MGKEIQTRNKKFAKLSPVEAEAKQRIANRKERLRQSNMSEGLKVLNNVLPRSKNGERRTQLSIILEAADRIQELEKRLQNAGIPDTQLSSGLSEMNCLPSLFSAIHHGTMDTQPASNDSSGSQLYPQFFGVPQFHQSDDDHSQFSAGDSSCRYQTTSAPSDCISLADVSFFDYICQPSLPYFSMEGINTPSQQQHIFADHDNSGQPKELSSCRFQSNLFGPTMTDHRSFGAQASNTQTSAANLPVPSETTKQFQHAVTSYSSCVYPKL